MQQQGEYKVDGDIQVVWDALNDPAVLGASMPGCESIEQIDPLNLQAAVRAKVGPVNAVFKATLTLSDVQAPNSYTLSGEVKGGAGVAKGQAQVQLRALPETPEGSSTLLTYKVQASVGGKLAQVGSRLVDGAAAKMADEFFAAFSKHFKQQQARSEQATQEEAAQEDATATEPMSSLATTSAEAEENQMPGQRASDGTEFIWATAFVVLITAMVLAL